MGDVGDVGDVRSSLLSIETSKLARVITRAYWRGDFDTAMRVKDRIPADVADYLTSRPGMLEFLRAAKAENLRLAKAERGHDTNRNNVPMEEVKG